MHKILARQLKKLGLSESSTPDHAQWAAFLNNINHYYDDTDADRYRIERSMDISSHEMQELNQKLQSAQDIAKFGYWSHNLITGENSWSLKLFQIFELDLSKKPPNMNEVISLVHPDDKEIFERAITAAIEHGTPYDIQIRMGTFAHPENYRWYEGICGPSVPVDGKFTVISGVAVDITERRNSELEIERLNSQLVDTARRAGMSEIATSILHNIGNVLNSANTTTAMIHEELNHLAYQRLIPVTQLIKDHKGDLAEYIKNDETGSKLPEYLIALNERIISSNEHMKTEINSLIKNLHHISEITSKHKSISGVSGINENLKLSSIINEAISICAMDIRFHNITIMKDLVFDAPIYSDKHKLIQIAVNLIKNAVESLAACTHIPEKIITISTSLHDNETNKTVLLNVSDNGLGIDNDTLKNLFKFGFTTKKDGHGFGLHGSALTASELNATLSAHSDGKLKGAKFTLSIDLPASTGAKLS